MNQTRLEELAAFIIIIMIIISVDKVQNLLIFFSFNSALYEMICILSFLLISSHLE